MYCDVLPIDESDYAFFAALYARYKLEDTKLEDTKLSDPRIERNKARKALRVAARKAREESEAARQAAREAERVLAEAEAARILQNEAAARALARKEEEFKVAQKALYEVRALLRKNHKKECHPLRKALREREKSCLERISFL
jgi:hypothetical protein